MSEKTGIKYPDVRVGDVIEAVHATGQYTVRYTVGKVEIRPGGGVLLCGPDSETCVGYWSPSDTMEDRLYLIERPASEEPTGFGAVVRVAYRKGTDSVNALGDNRVVLFTNAGWEWLPEPRMAYEWYSMAWNMVIEDSELVEVLSGGFEV